MTVTARQLSPFLILLSSACGGGDRTVTGQPGGGTDGPSLATLTVHVGVSTEDATLAQSLGWTQGVPGALVHLLRNGTATWKTATTDGNGDARFERVLPGLYRLYAGRALTVGEADAVGEPMRAFGDGDTFEVASRGEITRTLALLADRPGGLVISELNQWVPPVQETGNTTYAEALYFEVYNNSDQTIFLDGKTFGVSFGAAESLPQPCSSTSFERNNPAGVYAHQVLAFPGAGGEHPISPGEVKIIPISAIDHTSVHPLLWDLSHADFEIRGVASADNPSVPNMLDVGLAPFVTNFAGISNAAFFGSRRAFFLAESFDPQTLPIAFRDANGRGWVLVPADKLLDVVSLTVIFPDNERNFPPCAPAINKNFDRYEGGFLDISGSEDPRLTYQRRILRFDGNAILQNANTSAVDIMMLEPTPGTLPPP